jgi:branched-chain amino acid transport system permease protein
MGAVVGAMSWPFAEMGITYAWRRSSYLLPEGLEPTGLMQILPVDYKFAVTFGILVIVLIFRPTGIFKGKVRYDLICATSPVSLGSGAGG